jgi:Arginine deiminase
MTCLFDDVIWVRRARQEHDAFVDLMRERGAEVLLFHDLLAETLEQPDAREWVLSRRLRPEEATVMFAADLMAWMTEMPADELATRLTGGVTVQELPDSVASVIKNAMRPTDFVIAPCRTSCSCATRAPGSTAASRSTRCSGPPGSTRR